MRTAFGVKLPYLSIVNFKDLHCWIPCWKPHSAGLLSSDNFNEPFLSLISITTLCLILFIIFIVVVLILSKKKI